MITTKIVEYSENEKQLIQLLAENQEEVKRIPAEKSQFFSLALYDDDTYIGGITADKWMNATHISVLAIKKNYRGFGYGVELLRQVEAFAVSAGSELITVNSQDYQAKDFYESFGYQVFGQLANTLFKGTTKYYLAKEI